MKSNPITQRACTKYGSAPKNLEVTVDAAGTIPAKFEKMTPLKQLTRPGDDDVMSTGTGKKPLSDPISSDEKLEGGKTPDAVKDIQVSQTGGYGDVFYPKSPFYGGGFDTGITQPEREKVKTVSDNLLVQGAADLGASTLSKPVELDLKTDTESVPGSITSGEVKTSDDGRFVGPYERRQRQRAVRKTARDRKRGMIKEARLTGGDVSEARRQAKLAKARDIKAEAERMAGSNVDAYKTKFRGSGPKAPEIKTVKKNNVTFSSEKAANSGPGLAAQLAASFKDKSKAAGLKKANTPLFKMKGYGSNYKK